MTNSYSQAVESIKAFIKSWFKFAVVLSENLQYKVERVSSGAMPTSKKQELPESKRKNSKSEGSKTKKSATKNKIKSKKLSEDAKSRQQEQRAAVEEERRRLREELINSFLKVFDANLIDLTTNCILFASLLAFLLW